MRTVAITSTATDMLCAAFARWSAAVHRVNFSLAVLANFIEIGSV